MSRPSSPRASVMSRHSIERRDFRAPQLGHEEQPGHDAVDGRTRFGPFRGLEPAAGAPRPAEPSQGSPP